MSELPGASSSATSDDVRTAMLVLGAATAVVNAVQAGAAARGFADLRPVHGFTFARIAAGGATVVEVADHLGITKQAASKLVDQLVRGGYVRRQLDTADARRRPLVLTARGRRATQAAEVAAAEEIEGWRTRIGAAGVGALAESLAGLDLSGPVRPAW